MLLNGERWRARVIQIAMLALATLAPLLLSAAPIVATDPVANASPEIELELALKSASDDAHYALRWVTDAQDNHGLPFVIVDKKDARIFVFEANGRLRGASPALLGLTPGDNAVPGIEQREVPSLRENERTTPAGRFVSEPGHNLHGEAVVWIDYAAKLAMHRLRPAFSAERRAERLASATTDDNRISFGCIVVPVHFYETVVEPVLRRTYGVIYVLPETQPVQLMLGALQLSLRQGDHSGLIR